MTEFFNTILDVVVKFFEFFIEIFNMLLIFLYTFFGSFIGALFWLIHSLIQLFNVITQFVFHMPDYIGLVFMFAFAFLLFKFFTNVFQLIKFW